MAADFSPHTLVKPSLRPLCLLVLGLSAASLATPADAALDQNANQLSDVWETLYAAQGLPAALDADGDGFSTAAEALAGTDPHSALSHPVLEISEPTAGPRLLWPGVAGKRYTLLTSDSLAPGGWTAAASLTGNGRDVAVEVNASASRQFFQLEATDIDTDGDGLNDWEEATLGLSATTSHSAREDTPDFARVQAAWNAPSTISVGLLDGDVSERWPDAGVIAIRRSGGMKPVTVTFAIGGTAARGTDYTMLAGNAITLGAGVREAWVEFMPVADNDDAEADETITLTVQAAPGYALAAPTTATVLLRNEPAGSLPNAKAAARFLVQAAFGPDHDGTDADTVPENVEHVMAVGYDAWIDEQTAIQPPGYLEPFVAHVDELSEFYTDAKEASWWNRVMGAQKLWYPNGPDQPHDPLRQRMAYCLSQIFVVSDRPETLAVQPRGLANYYDLMVRHAFGNYRDLLFDVTMHPVMGFYLSHLLNKKPDPVANVYPDENYAREVMQLFSIGLWELNADGTRKLDAQDRPIPTYDNTTITNFARVFTGLGMAGNPQYGQHPENWLEPMKPWDQWHDLEPKTLVNGVTTPARTASVPDTGAATLADVNAAVDALFHHPNVGPFVGRQLIQRLVTSNPSPAYIGRVSAVFADNGQGVRGDLRAVLRAILLDPEARDPAKLSDPTWGKMREPFLKFVNFARAFDAKTQVGFYSLDSFFLDHQQEPLKSPSVFNFFLPGFTPQGELTSAGLVAPEFQILNATTAVSAPNHYFNALDSRDLHRWGTGLSSRATRPDLAQEEALAQTDVDALIRRLDLGLTCGNLRPREFQAIREAVLRVQSWNWEWDKERAEMAVYLIVTSPEFAVLR